MRCTAEKFSEKIVAIYTASVFDVIDQAKLEPNNNYIYYIDPPYVSKGQTLYPHNFKREEHLRLKNCLQDFQVPWILSYHDHQLIRKMYLFDPILQHISLDVMWVADRAKTGKELLISNLANFAREENNYADETRIAHLNSVSNEMDLHVLLSKTPQEMPLVCQE
ncbi:DNA adenine methylase [Dictyobacter kobayashii]|nr:DNA adenine methylase [Dictyobacter kobayashii]